MLQGGNSLTVGVGIVIEVIRKNNSDYDENIGGPDARPSIYDPIYLGTLLRQFSMHIPDFMTLILSSKHTVVENGQLKIKDRGQLNSASGTKIEPLGFDRFKTCELMAELLHCSNMGLLNEVGSEDYIRQRDIERENLRAQGAFDLNRKEASGMAYSENAGESEQEQGFRIEPQSATLENANASDDDGFEDVGSSKDLGPEIKLDSGEQTQAEKANVHEQSPGLHIENSIVEESLKNTNTTETTGLAPAEAPIDPISPTASGLTDSVNDIALNKNEQGSSTDEPNDQAKRPVELSQDTPTSTTQSEPQTADLKLEKPSSINDEGQSKDSQATPIEDEFAPQIQYDHSGQPVVGDLLKIQFVEHKVVPTILVS
jgi:SIT4-associating protein SAP185/190